MKQYGVGSKINQARKDLKMTGDVVAERVGINTTYLRQIEGGSKLPSLPVFVEICKVLNTSPNYLLAVDIDLNLDCYETLDKTISKVKCLSPRQIEMVCATVEAMISCMVD